MRRDLEDEEITVAPNWAWDSSMDGEGDVPDSDAENASCAEDDLPLSIAYKDHPGFGRF